VLVFPINPHSIAAPSRAARALLSLTVSLAVILMVSGASPAASAVVEAGYRDFSFGAGFVSAPTQDKPQSKLWYTDGSWWGGLFNPGDEKYHIFRMDLATHTWVDTGVVLDERDRSHADYLWDEAEQRLYVASAHRLEDQLVFVYGYDATTDTYTLDPAFPATGVVVGTGGSETITIAEDSTGQLWVAYTQPAPGTDPLTAPRNVMVNRSVGGDAVWGTPFILPTQGAQTSADDIAAIVAFGGNSIGVMWSNQNPEASQTAFYFATHGDAAADDAWSSRSAVVTGGALFTEDHINIKLATTASGRVLAVLKVNAGPVQVVLADRNPASGAWTAHVVSEEDHTRPQLVIDDEHGVAHVFMTSPTGGGGIYHKSAPLNALNTFPDGLGTPFMLSSSDPNINDVSTSKQNVNSTTGLLAIAADEFTQNYFHNFLPLGGRTVTRVFGPDRYATAAAVSARQFPSPGSGINAAYVATGLNFPDALAGGPAAASDGAPMLLVSLNEIPAATAAELDRLNPNTIYVLGSAGVVSDSVLGQLAAYARSGQVVRLWGQDRYETAAAIAANAFPDAGVAAVFVATGANFPDALAGAAAASSINSPVLLVELNSIPPSTRAQLERLDPAAIYVLGSEGVVSGPVAAELAAYAPVTRLGGADRYETAVRISEWFFDPGGAKAFVATGLNFPDALAGAPYGAPLHIVPGTSVPGVVANELTRLDLPSIDVLGSSGVVSDSVIGTLRAL
jgi:putative cell wall-binding protein